MSLTEINNNYIICKPYLDKVNKMDAEIHSSFAHKHAYYARVRKFYDEKGFLSDNYKKAILADYKLFEGGAFKGTFTPKPRQKKAKKEESVQLQQSTQIRNEIYEMIKENNNILKQILLFLKLESPATTQRDEKKVVYRKYGKFADKILRTSPPQVWSYVTLWEKIVPEFSTVTKDSVCSYMNRAYKKGTIRGMEKIAEGTYRTTIQDAK